MSCASRRSTARVAAPPPRRASSASAAARDRTTRAPRLVGGDQQPALNQREMPASVTGCARGSSGVEQLRRLAASPFRISDAPATAAHRRRRTDAHRAFCGASGTIRRTAERSRGASNCPSFQASPRPTRRRLDPLDLRRDRAARRGDAARHRSLQAVELPHLIDEAVALRECDADRQAGARTDTTARNLERITARPCAGESRCGD